MKKYLYFIIALLFFLQEAHAGVISVGTNGGGGTPGGTNGQIQYNNSGVFGGYSLGNTLAASSGILNTTEQINAQAASTSYTVLASDMGKTVTHNSASAVAETLPQAGTTGFGAGVAYIELNLGNGTETITPTTSTINGAATLALTKGQGAYIISDGTNWFAFNSAAAGGGSGTVNSGTQYQLGYYSSTGSAISGNSGIVTNASNQLGIGGSPSFALDIIGSTTNETVRISGSNTIGVSLDLNSTASGGHDVNFGSIAAGGAGAGDFCISDNTANTGVFCVNGSGKTIQTLATGVWGWSTGSSFTNNTVDTGLSRDSAGIVDVGNGSNGNTTGVLQSAGVYSKGTKFTTSGCSISSTSGGSMAGSFTLGANSCTAVITTHLTAPNGFACAANDFTAPTVLIPQSATTTTTASFSIPAGAGTTDVISFHCMGY